LVFLSFSFWADLTEETFVRSTSVFSSRRASDRLLAGLRGSGARSLISSLSPRRVPLRRFLFFSRPRTPKPVPGGGSLELLSCRFPFFSTGCGPDPFFSAMGPPPRPPLRRAGRGPPPPFFLGKSGDPSVTAAYHDPFFW